MRRVRGAFGMGVTWAVGWVVFGILIGITSKLVPGLFDWFFNFFDAPVPAMAIPGFIGGALFSVVLAVAGRRRTFHQLSLPRFAAWGAVGGLLVSLVPAVMVTLRLATPAEGLDLVRTQAIMSGTFITLGALSAAGSLRIARMSEAPAESDPELMGSGSARAVSVESSTRERADG